MNQEAEQWYTFDELLDILKVSPRKMRNNLRLVAGNCVREVRQDRGRPCKVYHHMSFPELAAWHKTNRLKITEIKPVDPQPPDQQPGTSNEERPLTAAQMAVGQLRLTAILEYRERRKALNAEEAADATCRDWAARPRETMIQVDERLPGNHKRTKNSQVSLGGFRTRTLREWDHLYMEKKSIKALAPQWANCGRKNLPVSERFVQAVYAIANSTARSDVQKAVDYLAAQNPDFPKASIRTWQRWIQEMDPLHAAAALNHSLGRFRQDISPDIETDWSKLGYNDLWTPDDATMDWHAYNSTFSLFRPFAYALQRVSTRQWIAIVTSETPVCNEQVRTLVGCAMTSKQGGIPGEIKFERGTVACDAHMEWLLTLLGVKVSRTTMNEGEVFPGSYHESKGHPQGKPTIESNFRKLHNLGWALPGQVGSEERHTMPARVEEWRNEAQRLKKEGKFLLAPNAHEYPAIIKGLLETHNNKPHSGLPEKIDPETGARVHLTPNEMAIHMKDTAVNVMPAEYLMMFHAKGERVPVTQNGIRLDNKSYGRFDQSLREFDAVTAYVDPSFPDQAYVQELGRVVELYEKANPGEYGDQFEKKRSCEKKHRNKYTAAIAAAIEAQKEGMLLVDQVNITDNPVPDRSSFVVSNEFLRVRIASMQQARKNLEAEKEAAAANMDFHADRLGVRGDVATPDRLHSDHSVNSVRNSSLENSAIGNRKSAMPRGRRKSVLDVGRRLESLTTVPVQQ
jgi:hypothetical protein